MLSWSSAACSDILVQRGESAIERRKTSAVPAGERRQVLNSVRSSVPCVIGQVANRAVCAASQSSAGT